MWHSTSRGHWPHQPAMAMCSKHRLLALGWHSWLPALPSQPESLTLTPGFAHWGMLQFLYWDRLSCIPASTWTSLHPPSQSCIVLGILPGLSVSSCHPCIHGGISASLLGIPSDIPTSTQALKDSKEQSTLSTRALPSLGCHSPSKPELTSPAPLGVVTCPSWWGEAKPLGPDPGYFLCELGNVSH